LFAREWGKTVSIRDMAEVGGGVLETNIQSIWIVPHNTRGI
jgi:hypothetical protein